MGARDGAKRWGTLYFLCGFILSGAGLFSFRVPLGRDSRGGYLLASRLLTFAGAMLGSILRLDSAELVAAAASLTATFAVPAVLERVDIKRKKRSVLAVAAGILSFAGGAAAMFTEQADITASCCAFAAAVCGRR